MPGSFRKKHTAQCEKTLKTRPILKNQFFQQKSVKITEVTFELTIFHTFKFSRVVDKTWNGHWVGTVDKTLERQPENRYFCVFYALFGVFFSSKSAWIVVSQKIVLEPPFLWCSLTLFHWLINENNQAQSKISWKCSILAWKLVKIDQKHRSRVLSTVPEFCPFQTFCPFQVLSTTLVEKTPKTLKNTPK